MLGTTNRGDPFHFLVGDAYKDQSHLVAEAVRDEGLSCLVVVGGDGSQKIALRLMQERGVPVVGVPKTIDNDLMATDYTFGFYSAVSVATEALDRLHTTAESHERVMFLEVMGRDAGHIALSAGIAGGADVILLPEIPYDPDLIAEKIRRRVRIGRLFSIVVVAEGALPVNKDGVVESVQAQHQRLKASGGAAAIAISSLSDKVDAEMRSCVLGHLQRGGSPVPFDRILATRFGVAAVDLVANERFGEMVVLKNGLVTSVPIEQAVRDNRGVDPGGELVATARAVGVEFGG